MHVAGNSEQDPYFKTGGYFIANLILWSSFITIAIVHTKSRKILLFFLLLLGLFLFVGLLPGSAFLRYWMFLPLVLLLLVIWTYTHHARELQPVFNLVLILQVFIFLFVVIHNLSLFPTKISPTYIQERLQNLYFESEHYRLPNEYIEPVCIVSPDTRMGFLYKLANPEIKIYSALHEGDCNGGVTLIVK
jgi:hypothetical protein